MSEYVGYTATVTTCATLVPQIVKVARTRRADDLSYLMVLLNLASSALWCAYGVLEDKKPMLVAGALSSASALTLLALKAGAPAAQGGAQVMVANSAADRV